MRRLLIVAALWVALSLPVAAATGGIIKVLPHYLDLQGRHALTPSLYDRDAYQAKLRRSPELRSALRFDIQWRARGAAGPLKLKVELRGTAKGDLPQATTLEREIAPGHTVTHWSDLKLEGEAYKKFGEVTAWRVTLCDGDKVVGEQKSFLW